MNAPFPCPECGGVLEVDLKCEIGEPVVVAFQERGAQLLRRVRHAPAALCSSCEFAIEIDVTAYVLQGGRRDS